MGVPERTRGKRRGKVAKVAALAGLVAILATGCSGEEVLRFGWPEGVTPEADRMRTLWTWSVIAALAVGVIVWGLIFWTVAFHRKKKGTVEALPRQFQYNVPLELFCVVVPVVMVCVLFFFTATTESKVLAKEPDPDVTVDVIAFQWNWEFAYPEEPETQNGQRISTVGSSTEIPLLVLPTDRTIQYNLRSTDVIHSFWVPEFNFKRDVMPYPEKNNQDNVFQNTIDREGAFVGRCAELCGTYHAMMNFEVRALSPDKYDRYIELRTQVNEESGQPNTAAEALAVLQSEGCGEVCSPTATTTKPFSTDRTLRTATG
ncbi:cytochrome c oxidase subunit II [Prauserella sp. PE36]|uniref:cytochrome-c oxidase n=1 Tax=Prauserella endophytica TaxID=1592324 RepID=A0ABY2S6D5_9PSEU|nr:MULTISPECIES: cytochrome c oxidase subunit II [Prauserella]PXY21699.1 cytochrome c oxidase subunit II [Prauserella coralliicola]RBM20077.1 cytochrome c oxidase subunit II [Prauserella sp. PE36]TKG71483.1 cytochrome c oxidase subunit II [Prauserella endophytica]